MIVYEDTTGSRRLRRSLLCYYSRAGKIIYIPHLAHVTDGCIENLLIDTEGQRSASLVEGLFP